MPYYVDHSGNLCEYKTGKTVRPATAEEETASRTAAKFDGGSGVIEEGQLSSATAKQDPVVLPIIHLNGSSAESLYEDAKAAYDALHAAEEVLRKMTPHGRDYYPGEAGLFEKARSQHADRLTVLGDIKEEVRRVALFCGDNRQKTNTPAPKEGARVVWKQVNAHLWVGAQREYPDEICYQIANQNGSYVLSHVMNDWTTERIKDYLTLADAESGAETFACASKRKEEKPQPLSASAKIVDFLGCWRDEAGAHASTPYWHTLVDDDTTFEQLLKAALEEQNK